MLLIAVILNKPKESLIDKSKNLNITINKHTRVAKHDHFELAHNRPPSKLQIRISNEQSSYERVHISILRSLTNKTMFGMLI